MAMVRSISHLFQLQPRLALIMAGDRTSSRVQSCDVEVEDGDAVGRQRDLGAE